MTAREFCRMVEKGEATPGEYILERYSRPTWTVTLCQVDNMTVIPEREQPAVVEVEAEPEPERTAGTPFVVAEAERITRAESLPASHATMTNIRLDEQP